MPPGYNHPARVAERIAALDLVSDGRVEFGTGESASILELGGYRVTVADKRAAWREALEQCLNMLVMAPYPGFEGKYFSMPCRNVVPKPLQKPHPPVWVACSNRETIKLAAQLGIGALTFAQKRAHCFDSLAMPVPRWTRQLSITTMSLRRSRRNQAVFDIGSNT